MNYLRTILAALLFLGTVTSHATLPCNKDCQDLIKLTRELPVLSFASLETYEEYILKDKALACRFVGTIIGETVNFDGFDSQRFVKKVEAAKILNELEQEYIIENLAQVKEIANSVGNALCLTESQITIETALNRLRVAGALYEDIQELIYQHLKSLRKI